jgi:uncharacterized protein YjbI with pentapeptide repeats
MTPLVETCLGGDEQLRSNARTAWCELFELDESTIKPMNADDIAAFQKEFVTKALFSFLKQGADATLRWNARPLGEKIDYDIDFTKLDLSGKDLSAIQLGNLCWNECNFDNSEMVKAYLVDAICSKATFKKANLENAILSSINATRADFSEASLKNSFCKGGIFKNANFKNADLTNATFQEGDIRGADFSGCTISDATKFEETKYDEHTKFCADFPMDLLAWKGTGVDPREEAGLKKALSKGVSNYDGFVEQIEKHFDEERVSKALAMLKKERFQIYSHISQEKVVGIVSSQTDSELFYACLLTAEGNFSCCTQNLKPCGGLKGSLCKHLLVLTIGLTRTSALTPNFSASCVLKSKFHQPKVDKDQMTAIFQQLKEAMAGEIDWRPTETIPEDYYS